MEKEKIARVVRNVYNKTDREKWVIYPEFKGATSFLDVTKLEIYDKSFLEGIEDEEDMKLDIKKLYNKNRSLKLIKEEKK